MTRYKALENLQLVGVLRASGYLADMTCSRVPHAIRDDMHQSLKCCDDETGKCASNPMGRQDVGGPWP